MPIQPNELEFSIGYVKLEPRRVLSATFAFGAGQLILDGFDAGQDLSFSQNNAIINGSVKNAYLFELDAGSWTGSTLDPNVELESVNGGFNNQLQIATDFFGGDINSRISIDGATGTPLNIDLQQISATLTTGELSLANITAVDSSLELNIAGRANVENLTVIDSNPSDSITSASEISVTATNGINVSGDLRNDMNDVGAGISLNALGNFSDVNVTGNILTQSGTIEINANDSIFLSSTTDVESGQSGDIRFTAGRDSASQIQIADGATLDSQLGSIALDNSSGGDVWLGNLKSQNGGTAISVIAGKNIFDNTSDELANLTATNGQINLLAGERIGILGSSAGDVDIVGDRLLIESGLASHLQTTVRQLDASVGGDLTVNNQTNLNLIDLDGDSAAITSNANAATLIINAGNQINIAADILAINAQTLALSSTDSISNQPGVNIRLDNGHAQFNAGSFVYLGNQFNDEIQLNSLGVATNDAHLEIDSSVRINGNTPNLNPSVFGSAASFGTGISETLFLTSTGAITQTDGNLNARFLALDAEAYVHLSSISNSNEALSITARGSAPLTDANTLATIDALANVLNSEVETNRDHSIAFNHRGTANISRVDSPTGSGSLAGLTSFSGSIFVSSQTGIEINQDIVAVSSIDSPQVTVYVFDGTSADPRINFHDNAIRVSSLQNIGVVNSPFTTATFFDSQGFPFRGTTEILVLNPDGSADQDIVLEYGHPGEAGYRVGVFWDNGIRPFNPNGLPVENLNTFVSNVNDPTEAYNDAVYRNFTTTIHEIGGNEGGRETISKIGAYSKSAIIAHQDDPKVFSLVTVRNDQHINLFSGNLATVDNSLNETFQTIRADLDSPKRFALELPPINAVNAIEIRSFVDAPITSTAAEDVGSSLFQRDVQPFETGILKWVQVEIPLNDQEELGDEVRLKDPTKDYPTSEDADEFKLDAATGENEVEKIIREIESTRDAEPGFWYKIFKDYKNRDDELFFYYLKTGEIPQIDLGPDSDFQSNASEDPINNSPDPTSPETPAQPEFNEELQDPTNAAPKSDGAPLELSSPESTVDLSTFDGELNQTEAIQSDFDRAPPTIYSVSPTTASLGLTAGSLVMASLISDRLQSNRPDLPSQSEPPPLANAEDQPSATAKITEFSRLNRIKRKLDQLVRSLHNVNGE